MRMGRQENGFDLQRFLSVRDGPNVRQAYDGATVAYTRGPWRFIALYTDPVQNRNLRAFDDYSSPRLSFGLLPGRTENRLLVLAVGLCRPLQTGRRAISERERRRAPLPPGRSLYRVWRRLRLGRRGDDPEREYRPRELSTRGRRGAVLGRTLDLDAAPAKGQSAIRCSLGGIRTPTTTSSTRSTRSSQAATTSTPRGYATYANLVHVKAGLSLRPEESRCISAAALGANGARR